MSLYSSVLVSTASQFLTLHFSCSRYRLSQTVSVPMGAPPASRTPTETTDQKGSQCPTLQHKSEPLPTQLRCASSTWIWTIIAQVYDLLWLALIIALPVLNSQNYIIGASAWYPFGSCAVNPFSGAYSTYLSYPRTGRIRCQGHKT